MAIGKEIEKLISAQGASLKAFSKKADISYNTLYAIVKRDNETVKPEILQKIASALDISYDQFLQSIRANMFSETIQRLETIHSEGSDFHTMTDPDVQFLTTLANANSLVRNELKRTKSQWAMEEISAAILKLSCTGMEEAVKRVKELTHIPPYADILSLIDEKKISKELINNKDS